MPRKPARHDPDPAADDLFGYPPRPAVTCPRCGRSAEPFCGDYCWACAQVLTAGGPAKKLPTGAGRKPRAADLPRPISPLYTRATTGTP